MNYVSADSFTYDEMTSSAEDVAKSTLDTSKIPKSVTINGKTASDENYLNMLTHTVVKVSNGDKSSCTIPSRGAPPGPSGSGGGTLTKSQYLTMAKNINSFYSSNGRAPNYATINGKDVRYESLVYGYSKILYAYERDGTLPSEMSFPLVSAISSSGITVDTTAPSTSRNLNPGWYNEKITVTLTANDNKDSSPKIYYSLNGGATQSKVKTASFTLNQGKNTLSYYSVDNKGNRETTKTATYNVDLTAPTITLSPKEVQGKDIAYNLQSITLTASDNMDSNPIIHYYFINDEYISGWCTATKSITLRASEGWNHIFYYTSDAAGNDNIVRLEGNKVSYGFFSFNPNTINPSISSNLESGTYNESKILSLNITNSAINNKRIRYNINNNGWVNASLGVDINLTNGFYVVEYTTLDLLSGFIAPYDILYIYIDNGMIGSENDADFSYGVQIPGYLNVTFDYVNPDLSKEYIIKAGPNGTIRMPIVREVLVKINGYNYVFRHFPERFVVENIPYYQSVYNGDISINMHSENYNCVYFIPLNSPYSDLFIYDSSDFINRSSCPGILIYDTNDFIHFEFLGMNEWDVDQFSVAYNNTGGQEIAYFIFNGEIVAQMQLSSARGFIDTGIREQLASYYGYKYDFSGYSYSDFGSNFTQLLRYTSTGELMEFTLSGNSYEISLPIAESIKTFFKYENKTIIKDEKININGYYPENVTVGFEIIQSFAIATTEVTSEIMRFWLDRSNFYAIGFMKASYGTFMNALSVLWLSDTHANELMGSYNVTWERNIGVVLAGINNEFRAYIHSSDPSLGRNISGIEDNVISFNFINSLMLSGIEHYVLSLTGNNVSSPLTNIILSYANNGSLVFIFDDDLGLLSIMIEGNDDFYIIIDSNTGLVYSVINDNGTYYKGAVTDEYSSNCYHNQLTSYLTDGLEFLWNELNDPHNVVGALSGLLFTAGMVSMTIICPPVGLAIIGVAILGTAYSSGLLDNLGTSNPGYSKIENWADFGLSMGLNFMGAGVAKSAAKPVVTAIGKTVFTSTSKYTGPRSAYTILNTGQLDKTTTYQYVLNSALGETEKEAVSKYFEEYGQELGISFIKNVTTG